MDIAVIGATGTTGQQIVVQLILKGLLGSFDRLQLVGRPSAEARLRGMVVDLRDAFFEAAPDLDVTLAPEDVTADIVVFAAGGTLSTNPAEPMTRDALAQANLPLFEAYAGALARHGHGHELVIVVSNPVELGVAVFARHLGRHRVFGMGAYQDTLRLRREIAGDLGITRQRVQTYMLGEHGAGLVPTWSVLRLHGFDAAETGQLKARLREGLSAATFPEVLARELAAVRGMITAGDLRAAFAYVRTLPPELRVALRPYAAHYSGAKTAVATANATVDMLRVVLSGHQTVMAAQVALAGDWPGLHGVLGVPVLVGHQGWLHVDPLELAADEEAHLLAVGHEVSGKLRQWEGAR
ncbi:malate dehydrogenase [Acidihalobacter ferrooxydans]|uniref:Lactate/malate dehydrogenase N-terminal domain-containing protein n=1 Tax=Acidihalobacter ferrooxydans TaxID=1765967 RepID=A0A1P8UK39_9GAMM|nr:hypothetical protein [Acidihalobacter ferrooxydans]APZ44206.1 hypothetical protein BW247_14840 [Acidihalobacter ferrooxydans]